MLINYYKLTNETSLNMFMIFSTKATYRKTNKEYKLENCQASNRHQVLYFISIEEIKQKIYIKNLSKFRLLIDLKQYENLVSKASITF